MVQVKSPKTSWAVKEVINSESDFCRHRFYPINYIGCKHPDRFNADKVPDCDKSNCPIKLRN